MGCLQSRIKQKSNINTEDNDIETVRQIQAYSDIDNFPIMQANSFHYNRYNNDIEANYAELQIKVLALEEVYYNMVAELKIAKTSLKLYDRKIKLMEKRFKTGMLAKNLITCSKGGYYLRSRISKE